MKEQLSKIAVAAFAMVSAVIVVTGSTLIVDGVKQINATTFGGIALANFARRNVANTFTAANVFTTVQGTSFRDANNNLITGFGCTIGAGSDYNILGGVGCTISTNSDNNFVMAVGQDMVGEIQRSVLLGGGGGWTAHNDVFNFNDSTSTITSNAVYFGCVNGFFISGPYVLDDNVALQIEATADGMADDKYNGVTLKGLNAGEAITQWDAVFFNVADSEYHQADADAAGEFPCRGIAVAAGSDGAALLIVVQGLIRNDGWTWTVGAPIYLSDTAGELTQTAPSGSGDAVQLVGWATSVDEMYVNVSGHYITAP